MVSFSPARAQGQHAHVCAKLTTREAFPLHDQRHSAIIFIRPCHSAKFTRPKHSRNRPKSLGRSIQVLGKRPLGLGSLGRSIQGVGQSHSAIALGLGQSDPGKAHSDSAKFTRPCHSAQVHSARPSGLGQTSSIQKSLGLSSLGRSIQGVGQSHSAIAVGLGQSDPGKAHSDSA